MLRKLQLPYVAWMSIWSLPEVQVHTESSSQPQKSEVVLWDGGSGEGGIQMFFIFMLQKEMEWNVSWGPQDT